MTRVIDFCPDNPDAEELSIDIPQEISSIIQQLAESNNTSYEHEFALLFEKALYQVASISGNESFLEYLQNNPLFIPE